MRAINHTVTGAVIGTSFSAPLALPLALLSHVVLDVIPHSGEESHTSRRFKVVLAVDALLSAAFLLAVIVLQPQSWLLIVVCGVLAAAPDLWWLPYWILELKGKARQLDPVGRFLSRIQWSESSAGYIVEAVWLAGMLYIFVQLTS